MPKWLIKFLIVSTILIVLTIVVNSSKPTLTNDLALTQLDDSNLTYVGWRLYNGIVDYIWMVYVAIVAFAYRKEIKSKIAGN